MAKDFDERKKTKTEKAMTKPSHEEKSWKRVAAKYFDKRKKQGQKRL